MSKWVLVTGSARRIGRAIALEMAENGWDVVLHYNRSESEALKTLEKIEGMKKKAHMLKVDFLNKRQTEE